MLGPFFEGDPWPQSFELDQQLFRIKWKVTPDLIAWLQILPDILTAGFFDYSGSKDMSLKIHRAQWPLSAKFPFPLLFFT